MQRRMHDTSAVRGTARASTLVDGLDAEQVATERETAHLLRALRQQLHEPLMPVWTDGEVLENEWRVYDHVPCQKGFEIIMAEHKTAYHAAWIPPDAPPGKHHHWTPLPRSTTTRAPLSKKRKAAVDEFVLSQRLAAAAR